MSNQGQDRRRDTRIETALLARCHSSAQTDEKAIALDLSLHGAQILVNKNHCFEGPIHVEIELDPDSRLQLLATPVWKTELDHQNILLGVRFDARQDCRLTSWLDEHTRFGELIDQLCDEHELVYTPDFANQD